MYGVSSILINDWLLNYNSYLHFFMMIEVVVVNIFIVFLDLIISHSGNGLLEATYSLMGCSYWL